MNIRVSWVCVGCKLLIIFHISGYFGVMRICLEVAYKMDV